MCLYTEFGELYSILRNNGYEEILNTYNILNGDFSNFDKFKDLLNNENFNNLTNEQQKVINDAKTFISGHSGLLEIPCQSDKIKSRIDNGRAN